MRDKVCHELKCWPEYFEALWDGRKTFELRKNDRGFQVGDYLDLREWKPESSSYTGRSISAEVTYALTNFDGVQRGYVVLGIAVLARGENRDG